MKNKFGIVNLVFLCVLVSIFALVPTISLIKNSSLVQKKFMGEVSSYQGVITIWNVDTFEGGSQSKSEFLIEAGVEFSKSHNGLYFLVENITPEEMINSFLNNVYPDIISFGFGVGEVVKPLLTKLNLENLPRTEVLNSAVVDGDVYAAGYLMGGYILASTEGNLMEAKKAQEAGLLSLTSESGYDKQVGKKQHHVASVVVGTNKYISPLDSLQKFTKTKINDYYTSESMYDAYLDFVSYNAGVTLLGTHRDLFKLSGRIKVGSIENAIIEYLEGYTNLVQYIGVLNSTEDGKKTLAEEYISYLLSEDMQKESVSYCMVNTIKKSYFTEGEFKSLEEVLNKDLVIPNIFS